MRLVEILENQKLEFNQFVADSPAGSFLQSWEWGEWQARLRRAAYRFKITDESGEIIGTIQLIKMPLPFGRYYLYAPYGPIVMKHEAWNMEHVAEEIKEKFPEAVFVRIEPKNLALSPKPLALNKTTNIQPGKTLVIDLIKSEDDLLAEMHPKTRYNIRLAQKHGVEIKDEFDLSIGHGLFAKEAVDLIVETANRQRFKGYGRDYYERMIDFFGVQNRGEIKLHIYKAIFKNKLLSSAIMIDFFAQGGSASGGGTRTFLFGGSSDQDKNIMAPYLLHWQAIKDAKVLGLAQYDFWGIETSKGDVPGFVRFKTGFAPGQGSGLVRAKREYAGAYDIVQNKLIYAVYRLGRKIIGIL